MPVQSEKWEEPFIFAANFQWESEQWLHCSGGSQGGKQAAEQVNLSYSILLPSIASACQFWGDDNNFAEWSGTEMSTLTTTAEYHLWR